MQFDYLETERLKLRVIAPEVMDQVMALPDGEIMEALGLTEEGVQTQKAKYEGGLTTHNRKFINFILVEKATGKAIGACGFHTWAIDHYRAEIGYHLNDDIHKQKGYMSEAVTAVLLYGFNELSLNRVEALAASYNVPSLRILEKHGFIYEGTLKEHYVVNGVPEDSVLYALLKKDFKGLQP